MPALTPERIATVQRYLDEGKSRNRIRQLTGIGRHTIDEIADGREQFGRPEYHRCPECGRKVVLPCIACREERFAKAKPGESNEPERDHPEGMRLKKEHRKRYRKVKQWREAMPKPDDKELSADHPLRNAGGSETDRTAGNPESRS